MSIIRDHMLADGSLSNAGRAAAAAVFELAQEGYVTIQLKVSGVRLTRTAKPEHDLKPEQKVLLKALFERGGKKVKQVHLTTPYHIPVAQTVAAQARALLVRDGSIRARQPGKVYRRARAVFWSAIGIGLLTLVAIRPPEEAWFVALFVGVFAWIVFASSTDGLKRRRVFRLKKSETRYKWLALIRNQCKHYMHKASIDVTEKLLPYELLWLRHDKLRSVEMGLHNSRPIWCDGDWPATPPDLTAALTSSMTVMAQCLDQPFARKKFTYTPDEEAQANLGEVSDKLGEGLSDAVDAADTTSELMSDIGDWGGGDGAGGDGGDGSGGDGGGDGGDG